ncbi:MAG: NTPase KAP [Rubrivivax sp.]|nr:MAG: NTPase KAP [Rubrivivax sp.]
MFLNDQETATDLLHYEAIARTVVRFINETPDAPVTIGVHGDWGAGKSSVLKMTESAFQGKDRVLCLWFNGWTFEGFEDAKTVVIETIIDELRRSRPTSTKVADAAKKVLRRVDWLKLARKAGGVAFTAATGIPSLGQLHDVVETVTAFVQKPQDQVSAEDLKKFASEAQQFLKDAPQDGERLPEQIHEFRKEFSALLKAAELDRLVVIIDDLDRCLPKTAIATLEAIRLFLMVERTAFVIGADEVMIEYAVREHFPDLPPSTGPLSYARNYLEKLIQVPFRVPALGLAETRTYITLLLAELALPRGDARFVKLLGAAREEMKRPWQSRGLDMRQLQDAVGTPLPEEIRQAHVISSVLTKILTEGTHGNPRQIKRFLNTMMLRQAIAHERGFGADIKLPVLGKIMLAERFYPDFYKQVAQLAAGEAGKPTAMAQFERTLKQASAASSAGADTKTDAGAKKVASKTEDLEVLAQEVVDWQKNEWIRGWASIEPALTDIDLRPYVFVTRDKRGAIGGFANSAHLETIVERLMGGKLVARGAVAEVAKLSPQELDEVFGAVSDKVLEVDDLKTEPKGVQGLMVLAERSPELERRLLDFAKALDISKVGVWPVAMISILKDAALVAEARDILVGWSEQDGNALLKRGAKAMGSIAKLT